MSEHRLPEFRFRLLPVQFRLSGLNHLQEAVLLRLLR